MKLTLLFEDFRPESQKFGNWEVSHDAETKEIFPKLPNGETIRVVHAKAVIYLTYVPTGEEITFWITKQNNHHDSRDPKKTFSKAYVLRELDRILGPEVGSAMYAAAMRDMRDAVPTPRHSKKTTVSRNPDFVPPPKEVEEPKEFLPPGVLKKEVHPYSQGGQVTAYDVIVGKVAEEIAVFIGNRPLKTAEYPDVAERLGTETEWFMIFKAE